MISYNVSLKSFVQLFLEYILFVDICCTKLYFNQPKGGSIFFLRQSVLVVSGNSLGRIG